MATATRNLSISKSAYVKSSSPNTHYGTNASTAYLLSGEHSANDANYLLFGLSSWPSSLKRNKLYCFRIRAYASIGYGTPLVYSIGDFNANTVTYATMPSRGNQVADFYFYPDNTGEWTEFFRPSDVNISDSSRAQNAHVLLSGAGFAVTRNQRVYGSILGWYMKTVLANGNTPYVEVTYDDSVKILSRVAFDSVPSGTVNPMAAQTVRWKYEKDTAGYCADENWTQASATLYWKTNSESNYHSVSISGSTLSYTFPAGTFPTGKTISCYVTGTDTDGTTTTTSTITFNTAALSITVTDCPSGNSVNSAAAATFSWTLGTTYEEHTQASAALYWRTESGSWNSVSISGNTKTKAVAAYTFPQGSTIEWYIRATDNKGNVAATTPSTFSTAATVLTITGAPTGSDVDSRNSTTFRWALTNQYGDYTQASARLYWKTSNADAWNQINVSGNTKQLTVSGYTFPANSTIQWYLTSTDQTGSVQTSNTASFKTLAVSVRMTGNPSGSNYDPRNSTTFSWSLYTAAGEYTQASAKLYWRAGSSGNWNEISISGNTKSYTVPANTFPTGATIQWYLSSTGKTDTTHSTNTASFSTLSPKITAVTYPSGNSVDFGSDLTFTWVFKNNAGGSNYGQRSASLFWRAATTDPWSEIPASGTTQQLTVPAYTFPSNATISWYLQGTDAGGSESSTTAQSFKTVAPQITPQNSPTSGYADPRNAITFSWFFSTGGSNYPQQSADFYWRVAGATTWNHVAASGSTQSVTIAANTFPLQSDIEWRLTGTDIGGTYSETTVYTFSTTASTAYAVCMDPVGKAVDGAKPVTLKWIVQNDDGSAASRTIVRWKLPSESQSQWHQLVDTTANITEYTVPEDTFPAGPIEWLVIAYNRDSAAGPASQASFVCIVAPDPPSGLTATAVPLTTISWQSTGQEAYELSIDGETVTEGFGSDVYSYRVKEPLPDGAHTISVRIQGSYGLWSEPAETQILVENAPKGSLTLTGEFGADADLYWEYEGSDDPETVAIYRDGKWIGTADGLTSARDRLVLGDHEYRVEYWFADGNYTRSNTVSGTMDCSTPMIAEISGGPWLKLRLSEHETRTQKFTRRRVSALSHITARAYPVLELSAYEDLTGGFDCAFRDREEAKAFERLFGRTVILKSRGGMVIMGGLTDAEKTVTKYYAAYSFSLQQIHVEDFVRYDEND